MDEVSACVASLRQEQALWSRHEAAAEGVRREPHLSWPHVCPPTCRGSNGLGQLLQGNNASYFERNSYYNPPHTAPVVLDFGPSRRIVTAALGLNHACAITDAGELLCW